MAVPPADRKTLLVSKVPPQSWYIAIGRYQGTEWTPIRYRHYGIIFRQIPAPFTIDNYPLHYNSLPLNRFQITTYTLGGLIINAFSSTIIDMAIDYGLFSANHGLYRIWPPSGADIEWIDRPVIGDDQVVAIADSFMQSKTAP